MTANIRLNQIKMDWVTLFALAALAAALNVGLHEGAHAVTCLLTGGTMVEFSALHVSCDSTTVLNSKIVSGTAAIYNIVLATCLFAVLRLRLQMPNNRWLFLWIFMLMNFLAGTGYFIFSGVANIGDWASVINGWEPAWVWRIVMTVIGLVLYMLAIWFSLKLMGQRIGGDRNEQIQRFIIMGIVIYVASAIVIGFAGFFHPEGVGSLPVVAGLMAALGGNAPFLWGPQWFRAKGFSKSTGAALVATTSWGWIITALAAVLVYGIVLGRGLTF